ncbi:cyclopropane-fatty-acyl-phospholipid synthase [Labrys miyagiensis]|uniref:Cyclopropane-fatty-acyl-phospholipid synthase n=1 Tax=Labrys miyagiensis TaxID=346912 RepID=A0ABQ6CF22_9HYPH|nr:cyclopropane-fatty-acyl-phospholipid synthase family protein [Labrys miyagiensis]GLS18217.1 cyclopropane-fatty-acyl-phospholipid synthase [Labrys miyagiensis]
MADITTQMQDLGLSDAVPKAPAGRSLTALLFRRLLSCLNQGCLTIVMPDGQFVTRQTGQPGPDAVLVLHRYRALRRLVLGGDVGFAEAYIKGEWSSPDLTALIELVARNGSEIIDRLSGSWPSRLINWLNHRRNANTKAGARRNIEFHYDLGNEFYRRWLCSRMLYSAAIYEGENDTLEEAQERKLEAIAAALDLAPEDRVLEIGCGWGALAVRLAAEHRVAVTGVTLSQAQLIEAWRVAQQADVWSSTDLRLQDYRDIEGTFDRIVSIEMIEAVGERFLPSYFRTLAVRLARGGRVVVQAITIAEERFETYRANPDFIQRYIFPGGFLPTKALMRERLQEAGLKLVATQNFGLSYARTLGDWRERFEAAWPEIARMGYSEAFRRMWTYYLCYCEAGFRAGALDVGLYSLEHAGDRA